MTFLTWVVLVLVVKAVIVFFLWRAFWRHVPPAPQQGNALTRLYIWRVHVKGMPRGFKVREVPWTPIVLLLSLVSLCSCEAPEPYKASRAGFAGNYVERVPDDNVTVTCWVYKFSNVGGISCLPDSTFTERRRHQ